MNTNNFYYEKYGSGEKIIIILPGWGDNRKTFDFYINSLKDKFTIYIFDYPGFGKSTFPNKELTIYDYSNYIKNFIKENNINSFYIICHSFGCRIATILIGKDRLNVERLIIIGGAGIRRKSIKRTIKIYKYKLLKKLNILLPKSKRKKYLNNLLMKYGSNDYKNLNNLQRKTFINIINEDLRNLFKYIYSPTILIWGEKDYETPLKDAKYMNRKIKDSALITLKKGTHFVYLEYPFYIIKIIINFFN